MAQRPFTLQAVDPLTGRKLGPPRVVRPLEDLVADTAPADLGDDEYPDGGNIATVLAWVDDPAVSGEVRSDRAKAAIVAEHGRDQPRKTLLAELTERTG